MNLIPAEGSFYIFITRKDFDKVLTSFKVWQRLMLNCTFAQGSVMIKNHSWIVLQPVTIRLNMDLKEIIRQHAKLGPWPHNNRY